MTGRQKGDDRGVGQGDYFRVSDTFWGYIIGPGERARQRAGIGEILAVLGSLAFGGIAFAQWLLPASNTDPLVMPFKIGVTAVFFLISAMLYLMAKKGLTLETQIDLHEKEIRVVRRNRSDESVTLENYRFDQVTAIDSARSRGKFLLNQLNVGVAGSMSPVVLATAPESALAPVASRIRADLGLPEEKRTAAPKSVFARGRNSVRTALFAK